MGKMEKESVGFLRLGLLRLGRWLGEKMAGGGRSGAWAAKAANKALRRLGSEDARADFVERLAAAGAGDREMALALGPQAVGMLAGAWMLKPNREFAERMGWVSRKRVSPIWGLFGAICLCEPQEALKMSEAFALHPNPSVTPEGIGNLREELSRQDPGERTEGGLLELAGASKESLGWAKPGRGEGMAEGGLNMLRWMARAGLSDPGEWVGMAPRAGSGGALSVFGALAAAGPEAFGRHAEEALRETVGGIERGKAGHERCARALALLVCGAKGEGLDREEMLGKIGEGIRRGGVREEIAALERRELEAGLSENGEASGPKRAGRGL